MTIAEKVAYVRGLVEGLELEKDKKETKIIMGIIDVLDDMALTVSDIEEGYNDVCDQLDAVDEDLYLLEKECYDEDCCCDEEEDIFYEVTCPSCKETTCLSEDILLKGGIDCPNCGETLEFDLEDICDCEDDCDDDCDCGCKD